MVTGKAPMGTIAIDSTSSFGCWHFLNWLLPLGLWLIAAQAVVSRRWLHGEPLHRAQPPLMQRAIASHEYTIASPWPPPLPRLPPARASCCAQARLLCVRVRGWR